jgi:hypothetical protein
MMQSDILIFTLSQFIDLFIFLASKIVFTFIDAYIS